MTPARRAQALLRVVPALLSSTYLIARLAAGVIGPHHLALGRWTLTLVLMMSFVSDGLLRDGAPWRHEWKQLMTLVSLGMWICGAFV